MGRTTYTGPVAGGYTEVACFLNLTGDKFQFAAPWNGRIVEISRYCETSSSGIVIVSNITTSATWIAAGALTSDTTAVTAAASIAGNRTVTKGDIINVQTAGTTATNVCVLLTFYCTGHVAASPAND